MLNEGGQNRILIFKPVSISRSQAQKAPSSGHPRPEIHVSQALGECRIPGKSRTVPGGVTGHGVRPSVVCMAQLRIALFTHSSSEPGHCMTPSPAPGPPRAPGRNFPRTHFELSGSGDDAGQPYIKPPLPVVEMRTSSRWPPTGSSTLSSSPDEACQWHRR